MGQATAVTERPPEGNARAAELARAYDALADALEDVDLDAEPRQADELIAALSAVGRAYDMATDSAATPD